MKKLLVLALVLGSLMLTGCAAHLLTVSNNNLNQTETILTQKNFKVVGQAEGKAVATYICGIGGLSKKASVLMLSQRCTRQLTLRVRRPSLTSL